MSEGLVSKGPAEVPICVGSYICKLTMGLVRGYLQELGYSKIEC